MKKIQVLFLAAVLLASCLLASALFINEDQASQTAQPAPDKTVERLAGLGKVWGTVKFFHPYLAYKDIDWDKALVEAIPKVRAAATAEDYRAALEYLLSFLKDPASEASIDKPVPESETPPKKAAPPAPALPEVKWPAPDVAYLEARRASQFTNPQYSMEFMKQVSAAAGKAKAIIFDVRQSDEAAGNEGGAYYFYQTIISALSSTLSRDIPLPSSRHIMYSGFPTQRGSSSGGYYSAFVYAAGGIIPGQAKLTAPISLIFLINKETPFISSHLNGLQLSGAALIIQEGPALEQPGSRVHLMDLPDGVRVIFQTAESINPDGSTGFAPALTLPDPAPGAPDAAYQAALDIAQGRRSVTPPESRPIAPCLLPQRDKPYSEMAYPSAEYRLLALYRFWNIINYFFPYKHLLDRPWEEVLAEFIPRMEKAKDATEYALTVAEMVSQIHDTHGFVNSQTLNSYFGQYFPPLEVKLIEGQTVVTGVTQDPKAPALGVEVGDIVLAVDGENSAERRERLGRFIAASTPQALEWRVHGLLLGGAKDSQIRLTVKNKNGETVEKILTRSARPTRSQRTSPIFRVLPEGFGYFDLARLNQDQVDAALEAVKETPALIFDMRGYPRGTAWSITPRLIDKKTAVAKFQRPEPHGSSIDWPSRVAFDQEIEPGPGWKYRGKIVVLINEEAISQAEHTCMFFEAAAGATFIGSSTNGANGDVTVMVLPGEIYVNFTGHDVRHADGRQLQRVGIQPHVLVKPTIEGIRQGKDEVLEKAVEYLKAAKKK